MEVNIKDYSKKQKAQKKPSKDSKGLRFDISFQRGFTDKNKERFYRELSVLLASGITLKKALEIVLQQTKNKKNKETLQQIFDAIVAGKSLHDSVKRSKKFSAYEVYSIKIGEETNNLKEIFEELRLFFDRRIQIRRQITTISAYPIFVVLIAISVLTFMLKSVVPMFGKVFKQFGKELPSLTKKIIYLSNNFTTILIVFFLIVVAIIVIHRLNRKTNGYRKFFSSLFLKIPFLGPLIRTIYLARFCQTLSLLLGAKLPLIESLDLIKRIINYHPIESTLEEIKKDIITGKPFGESLGKHKIYESSLVSMIKVAEEVNELDEMLNKLSKQYTEEVEFKTKTFGVVMEPLIITIIGGLVGVIMIAMYLPMFDLSKILNAN